MTISAIAGQIVEALTSALTGSNGLLQKIPEGIKTAFESLFLTTTGTGESAVTSMSTFAVVMCIFGGVALAFGITRLIWQLVARKVGC